METNHNLKNHDEQEIRYFFERYERISGNEKFFYLIEKARELLEGYGCKKLNFAELIMQKCFSDFPLVQLAEQIKQSGINEEINVDDKTIINDDDDDETEELNLKFEVSLAYIVMAKVLHSKGQDEKCFEYLQTALQIDNILKNNNGAWFSYCYFVVANKLTEFYDEAEKELSKNYDTKLFNFDYSTNVMLSYIAEEKQDAEKQKYYSDLAENMLIEDAKQFKPLYYNALKKVNCNDEVLAKAEDYLISEHFTRVNEDDRYSYIRQGFACQQHFNFIVLFDTVIVKAYISSYDFVTGTREVRGLNGFIALTGKQPLKKRVKQFEKIIMQHSHL